MGLCAESTGRQGASEDINRNYEIREKSNTNITRYRAPIKKRNQSTTPRLNPFLHDQCLYNDFEYSDARRYL